MYCTNISCQITGEQTPLLVIAPHILPKMGELRSHLSQVSIIHHIVLLRFPR